MFAAKLSNPCARLPDHLLGHGQHDAHVMRIVETLARQTEYTLFANQRLQEFHFTFIRWEVIDVDANHHVHGAIGHNWLQTNRIDQNVIGQLCMFLRFFRTTSYINFDPKMGSGLGDKKKPTHLKCVYDAIKV